MCRCVFSGGPLLTGTHISEYFESRCDAWLPSFLPHGSWWGLVKETPVRLLTGLRLFWAFWGHWHFKDQQLTAQPTGKPYCNDINKLSFFVSFFCFVLFSLCGPLNELQANIYWTLFCCFTEMKIVIVMALLCGRSQVNQSITWELNSITFYV